MPQERLELLGVKPHVGHHLLVAELAELAVLLEGGLAKDLLAHLFVGSRQVIFLGRGKRGKPLPRAPVGLVARHGVVAPDAHSAHLVRDLLEAGGRHVLAA